MLELQRELLLLQPTSADERPFTSRMHATPSKAEQVLEAFLEAKRKTNHRAESLLETIREHAEPTFEGSHEVSLEGAERLLVSATPAHQAWVESFLALQRQPAMRVQMDAIFFSVPLGTSGLEGTSQAMEASPLAELEAKLEAIPQREVLVRASVVVYARREAVMQKTTELHFLMDYQDVALYPDDQVFAAPIIGTLEQGIRCTLRALPLAQDTYSVNAKFRRSHLEHMRTYETTAGGAFQEPLEFHLPEVSVTTLQTRTALKLGQGLMMRTPFKEEGREYIVLLRLLQPPPEVDPGGNQR